MVSFPLFVVMNGNNPVRDCVLSGSFRLEYIFRDIWGCVWIRLGDPESIVFGGWAREDPFLQSLVVSRGFTAALAAKISPDRTKSICDHGQDL